jgi:hypothetical protein
MITESFRLGVAATIILGVVFIFSDEIGLKQSFTIEDSNQTGSLIVSEREPWYTPFELIQLPNPTGKCDSPRLRQWDSGNRKDRFPDIEERVCHLMTVWYDANLFESNPLKRWVSPFTYRYIHESDDPNWKQLYVEWDDNRSYNVTFQNKIGPVFPFHVAYQEQQILRDLAASRRKQRLNNYDRRIQLRKYMFAYANDFVHMVDAFGSQNKTTTPIVALFGDNLVRNLRFPLPAF